MVDENVPWKTLLCLFISKNIHVMGPRSTTTQDKTHSKYLAFLTLLCSEPTNPTLLTIVPTVPRGPPGGLPANIFRIR